MLVGPPPREDGAEAAGRVGRRATWQREHRRFAHETPGCRKRHRLNLLIGIDVSEFLLAEHSPQPVDHWMSEWGVDIHSADPGGLRAPERHHPLREVFLLQRKAGKKMGQGPGKTTGWIHRTTLKMKRVEMIGGVNYERIGPQGLFVTYGEDRRDGQLIGCDTIVLCAGQEPLRELQPPLEAAGVKVHLVGGADEAAELDAKRAIDQGTRLAATL